MTFDTPKTKALAQLIEREGPNGTGRIVGLSMEGADGVFVYTESAQWCDDSGSGTFRGDSETAAVQAFRDRVTRGNGCKCCPAPAEHGLPQNCEGDCIPTAEAMAAEEANTTLESRPVIFDHDGRVMDKRESALAPSESRATVWANARPDAGPVASLARPRIYGDQTATAGLFTMHDTAGQLVKVWTRNVTIHGVRFALEQIKETRDAIAKGTENMTASECRAMAEDQRTEAAELGQRATKETTKGTPRRAMLLNLSALRHVRATELESIAKAKETAAKGPNGSGGSGPGLSLSSLARPRVALPDAIAETPGTELESNCWPGSAGYYREAREARADATGFRLLGQSGAFPLWAIASEREAAAIDDSEELGLDPFDPFAPGWLDSSEERGLWA